MAATSAALCLWRTCGETLQLLIVHPGGPFWASKDDGAWSLPKGEYDPTTEDGLAAARREFREEMGTTAPPGAAMPLGQTTLKSGKIIHAWAIRGDLDADAIVSNTFEMEWPPRSGRRQHFPEVDRAQWCDPSTASHKLNAAQVVFVERLVELSGVWRIRRSCGDTSPECFRAGSQATRRVDVHGPDGAYSD